MTELDKLGKLRVRQGPILLAIASQIPLMLRRRRGHNGHSSIGVPSATVRLPFFLVSGHLSPGVNRRSPNGLAAKQGRGKAKRRQRPGPACVFPAELGRLGLNPPPTASYNPRHYKEVSARSKGWRLSAPCRLSNRMPPPAIRPVPLMP